MTSPLDDAKAASSVGVRRIAWKARTEDPTVASFRYRVLVPQQGLAARGYRVELFRDADFEHYTDVVFSKTYSPTDQELAQRCRAAGKSVIFDICDNHFYNPDNLPKYVEAARQLRAMIGLSDRIICSTDVLADIVRTEANLPVRPLVVGDVVEYVPVAPASAPPPEGLPQLLWFGSHGSPNAPSGMLDILLIAEHLRAAYREHPFELVVASNNERKFLDKIAPALPVPCRYVAWSTEAFPALLTAARAVILPLSDNPFVAAKTHNRLSLALAAGIPVVGDIIDSYREFAPFCYLGDWPAGLRAVLSTPEVARQRAAAAQAYMGTHWSDEHVIDLWAVAMGLVGNEEKTSSMKKAEQPVPAAAAPAAAPPRIKGRLVSRVGRLDGWAYNPSTPDQPVQVVINDSQGELLRVLANRHRPDLKDAGYGAGNYGFDVPLPLHLCDGHPHRLKMVDAASGQTIAQINITPTRLRGTPAQYGVADAMLRQVETITRRHLKDRRADMAKVVMTTIDHVPDLALPFEMILLRVDLAMALNQYRRAALLCLRAHYAYGLRSETVNRLFKALFTLDRRELASAVVRRIERSHAAGMVSNRDLAMIYAADRRLESVSRFLIMAGGAEGEIWHNLNLRIKMGIGAFRFADNLALIRHYKALGLTTAIATSTRNYAQLEEDFAAFYAAAGLDWTAAGVIDTGDARLDGLRLLLTRNRPPAAEMGARGVAFAFNELGIGGTQRQIVNAAQALKQSDWAEPVTLICESLSSSFRHDHYLETVTAAGLPIELLPDTAADLDLPDNPAIAMLSGSRGSMREALDADAILRAVAAIRRVNPRIVHVRQNWSMFTTAALLCGTPRILIHIGLVPEKESAATSERALVDYRAQRDTLRLLGEHPAVQFVLNSQVGVDEYADWLELPRHKFSLVYNSFDSTQFQQPTPGGSLFWRQQLGIPAAAPVIGSVMRLSAQKNPRLWLKVCREVAGRVPHAHFIIIGDGVMQEEVTHVLKRFQLEDRVHFYGSAKQELGELYGIMDVLLLTSRREGLPNCVVEAQFQGVPVVASDVAGTSEALLAGVTGYVVDADDVGGYVDRIIHVLENPVHRQKCQTEGCDFIRARFGIDRMVRDLMEIYG